MVLAVHLAVILFPLLHTVAASPFPSNFSDEVLNARDSASKRAGDFYLRVMPLGASITKGDPAQPDVDTAKNGYRKPLRDRLRADGWEVNMVGSVGDYGTMNDRDNEGHPGWRVLAIHDVAKDSIKTYKPNLILINAGTNDANNGNTGDEPVQKTHERMEAMILDAFSIVPDAVIVLSTLLPKSTQKDNVDLINADYRALAKKLYDQGRRVVLAEMNDGFIPLDDIWDGTHPNLLGQRKMAAVWREAIAFAEAKDWLRPPSTDVGFNDSDAGTTCEKTYGSGNNDPRAGWQILGAGDPLIKDDGTYIHKSSARGSVFSISFGPDSAKYYFAQLVNHGADRGGELDELIETYIGSDNKVYVIMHENLGGGKFGGGVQLDVKDGCIPRGIRWGDVDNDGLEDFICIGTDGAMYVSKNIGGNPPQFRALGTYKAATSGYAQANVRLGDIDGDGRLDYCLIGSNDGNIRCWRNGGVGEKAAYWQDMGSGDIVFPAKGMGDIRGVRFVDINGDFRGDWLWVSTNGQTTTYVNQRGEGKGMVPRWLEAGVTHGGGFDVYDPESRNNIQFGRVYGSGRRDYAHIERKNCRDTNDGHGCEINISIWENLGSGGKFQKGDGSRWGDMRGRGLDDYIWISPDGVINVFPNQNTKEDVSKDITRGIWGSSIRALETGMDRRALHIGDWDGDGRDDVIGVDKATGSLTVWKSNWVSGTNFGFTKSAIPGSDKCKQGWGVGYFDNGIHFADITGEGKVDYLCMEPNGRTTAWLNDATSTLRDVAQVKFSNDLDRANYQFADVNGDGRADLIWTDKFSGDARVWQNAGELPEDRRESGSKFHWDDLGLRYQGSSRGPNMHFPNLGGQGRADMVQVNPTTAHGWIWFNSCSQGGDDPEMNPNLPDYNFSWP